MLVYQEENTNMQEKIVTILNEMADYLDMFLAAKQIEGCSERTIKYYKMIVAHLF